MPAHSSENLTVRYGETTLSIPLPAQVQVDRVGRRAGGDRTSESVLAAALHAPIMAWPFSEFLHNAQAPLVVVNDATRSTPTEAMLKLLMPQLAACPNWRVIVATGLHRAPTDSELQRIFGETLPEVRSRLCIHDGHDSGVHRTFATVAGVVAVNRALTEADRIIILTSVEPHFFAGYTGGRKSIIPGLAGAETVRISHAGAVDRKASPLRIDGNPVRQFIERGTQFVPPDRIWAFQAVLDRDDQVAAAFAGDIDKTFASACVEARNAYAVTISERYDIVLSVVNPPLDLNLYQAEKGWELSQDAVRDRGMLIVVSPCHEGVGASFYADLVAANPECGKWEQLAAEAYRMGAHKLIRTARARRRFHLGALTDMPVDLVRRFGYEAYADLQTAVVAAIEKVGTPARMLIVEDAGLTTVICHQ